MSVSFFFAGVSASDYEKIEEHPDQAEQLVSERMFARSSLEYDAEQDLEGLAYLGIKLDDPELWNINEIGEYCLYFDEVYVSDLICDCEHILARDQDEVRLELNEQGFDAQAILAFIRNRILPTLQRIEKE